MARFFSFLVAILLVTSLLPCLATADADKEDARVNLPNDILSKALTNRFRFDSTLTMGLTTTIRGSERKEKKVIEIISAWKDGKLCTYAELTEPAEAQGRKFFFIRGDDGSSYQKIYLPALKKVRGISLAQKKDPFEGSELNYEDVEVRRIEDYEVLSAEPDKSNGEESTRIVVKPLYESVYDKTEYFIASDGFILAILLYEKGTLVKSIRAPRSEMVEQAGHRLPTMFVTKNELLGGETVVSITNLVVNPPLSTDKVCSERQLTASR